MTDSQIVTIDYLLSIINQNNVNIKDLAQKSGIEYTNLNSILNKKRVIGDKTIIKLSEALGVSYQELKNPKSYLQNQNSTTNCVKERESTYSSDSVEIPEFVGENPQVLFLEKLRYLSKIGEMREAGLLDEEEFLKIKSRLINIL